MGPGFFRGPGVTNNDGARELFQPDNWTRLLVSEPFPSQSDSLSIWQDQIKNQMR